MEIEQKLLACPCCGLAVVVPADGTEHPCSSCGLALSKEPAVEPQVPPLISAFRYPFASGAAVTLLLVMAPLWALIRALSASLIGGLGEMILGKGGILLAVALLALFGGYIAAWLWEILESTGAGDDTPPPTPWPSDYVEFGRAFFRFVAAFATAFLPALVVRGWPGIDSSWKEGLASALALAGMAYYPMALLLVGFSGGWTAGFRLPTAVRALRILGIDYALCSALVFVSLGLSTAVEFGAAAAWVHAGPWAGLAASIGAAFLELTLFATHMRAVGLVYRANSKELVWFR